jgi:Caspase domain
MMRRCVAILFLMQSVCWAELTDVANSLGRNSTPKYALVIGNSEYEGINRNLKNPQHDARLMTEVLAKIGFEVQTHNNLSRAEMSKRISEFAAGLPSGSTALVFYAGHGVQIGGDSYLMPVDIQLNNEQGVQLRAYPLRRLLDELSSAKTAVNIVVLDACRDNPFQPQPPIRYRSVGPMGLAKVQAPRGTLVAFSTQPGQLAADGAGYNSVYTSALASSLLEPKMTLEDIFKRVNTAVRNKTKDEQIPWYESSITENYFFLPPEDQIVVSGKGLIRAANTSQGRKRSDAKVGDQQPKLWYLSMSDYEWSKLDYDIEQRAKYLQADELPELLQMADGGNVVAMTTLGQLYTEDIHRINSATGAFKGVNVRIRPNQTIAINWLKKAAVQGFPVAQTLLGESYVEANGVRRDLAEAQKLFGQAAKANYARAKIDLAQVQFMLDPSKLDLRKFTEAFTSIQRNMNPNAAK